MKRDDLIEIVIVALVVISLLGIIMSVKGYRNERFKQEILKELK
jgi:hypothetical protein